MATIKGYEMPDDLYYHQDHAWARVEDNGNVRVGMNDMFQETAGDIVYVDLPFEGDEVKQGETCSKIQSSKKWIGKLIAPVAGEVVEVNKELESDSTVINSDPYGDGWIMLIKPSNLDENLSGLMQGETVENWLKEEIAKAEAEKKE